MFFLMNSFLIIISLLIVFVKQFQINLNIKLMEILLAFMQSDLERFLISLGIVILLAIAIRLFIGKSNVDNKKSKEEDDKWGLKS